jgi:hypothetical protein
MPQAMQAAQDKKSTVPVKVSPHRSTAIRASFPSALLPPDIKQRSVFPGEDPFAGIPEEYHERLSFIFDKITPGSDGVDHIVIVLVSDGESPRSFVDFQPDYGVISTAYIVRQIEQMIAASENFHPKIDPKLLCGGPSIAR